MLAVVCWHSGLPLAHGGFTGVDLFLVISGYVIFRSLMMELPNIDWSRFFIRRLRRLLPMLLLTVTSAMPLAYLLLPPFGPLQDFSKSALASLAFGANFFFWRWQGSYFGTSIQQSPLLHLWSLGIEEQFYLGLPLLFLLLRWKSRENLFKVIAAVSCLSFAVYLWGVQAHPTATFYLPLTRAWEFGLGAMAALAPKPETGPKLSASLPGLLLVGIMPVLLWPHPIPSPQAGLLLAAALAVLAGLLLYRWHDMPPGSTVNRLLGARWLRWIGLRSYAWYLLHWPALVFYRAYHLQDVSWSELMLVSFLSLLLADGLYRWFENPLRYWSPPHLTRMRLWVLSVLLISTVAVAAIWLGNRAYDWQTADRWQAMRQTDTWVDQYLSNPEASNGIIQPTPAGRPATNPVVQQVLLWGDSHAAHLTSVLNEAARTYGWTAKTLWMGGCPPLLPDWRSIAPQASDATESCQTFRFAAWQTLMSARQGSQQDRLPLVLLSARWEIYFGEQALSVADIDPYFSTSLSEQRRIHFSEGLRQTVEALQKQGFRVIILAPTPELIVPAPQCASRFGLESCGVPKTRVEHYRRSAVQAIRQLEDRPGVTIIDPISALCDADVCPAGGADGLWYLDDDHLLPAGAHHLQTQLEEVFAAATAPVTH